MNIKRIYLGTWLPRTRVHLEEIYDFLNGNPAPDADDKKTREFHQQLNIENLRLNNNQDFDNIKFTSDNITTTITEDGVIFLSIDNNIDNPTLSLEKVRSFYVNRLGPSLAFLFRKGAPLPQTLIDIKETYPHIFVGENIESDEIKELLTLQNDQLLTEVASQNLAFFYGKETEIISTQQFNAESISESLIVNIIFIQSYSDLLRRYLTAHRTIWTDISLIKESGNLRYRDFTNTRNRILNFLKTISFIKTRLKQMIEILSAREAVTTKAAKQQLISMGLERFEVLRSSSLYFLNLWEMTADYANSTLTLFESLVEENTQRELRILQQITIAGMLVGFFGMNIAFPWEERWPEIFPSSFIVLGIIIVTLFTFYQIFKRMILNRHFNISSTDQK